MGALVEPAWNRPGAVCWEQHTEPAPDVCGACTVWHDCLYDALTADVRSERLRLQPTLTVRGRYTYPARRELLRDADGRPAVAFEAGVALDADRRRALEAEQQPPQARLPFGPAPAPQASLFE